MIKEYRNFEIIEKKSYASNFIWELPFDKIKKDILGTDFECSLNFIDPTLAQKLNINNRKKDYIPNVLTFPLSENSGEIYICKAVARTQYKDFNMRYKSFITLLFIHGCLHLKGLHHNTLEKEESMVKLEYEYLEKYNR